MVGADAIVVGLGAMGSATVYQLARRGARVLGIDRFSPPHEQGSSHGETRITRQAIGEGEIYVPLVLRSHEIWRELEAETGEELLLQCGGLIISGAHSSHPKKADFLRRTIAAAEGFGIAHEVLGAAEIAARFPQFLLQGDERAYFEPGAGLLYPERCIATQLALARRAGATLHTDEVVHEITSFGGGVTVRTDRATYQAGAAVVAAGAWSPGLVGAPLAHMSLYRQVLNWYEVDDPSLYAPGRFPVFMWMHGAAEEQCYGFPIPPGFEGLKIASEAYEAPLSSPRDVHREVAPDETRGTYERHVAGRFRNARAHCLRAKTCFYTMAPDSLFTISDHPDSEHITIVSACSGHGFKHSAAIGEAVADKLLDGGAKVDLTGFALPARNRAGERPGLTI